MSEEVIAPNHEISLGDIERLEAALLETPAEIPIDHTFAPGVYVRKGLFRAGLVAIGHQHKTEHISIVLKGRFSLLENGKITQIVGPCVFVSPPGVRKVAYFHEDTVWTNIHPNPTNETSQEKLEEIFITKSETWLRHYAIKADELAQLKDSAVNDN